MNILDAIDKHHRREISRLRRENRALRRRLAELDAQSRQDRRDLGAALITVADRNAEIERIRRCAETVRRIGKTNRSQDKK